MNLVDWIVVVVPVLGLLCVGLWTRRHVNDDVVNFLAAGRAAGRYLVCNAEGTAALGAITFIAIFQVYYKSGLGVSWWGSLSMPVGLAMILSGFVIYRYRETRALTMAQFFEMRYSRRFRIFMGILMFCAGVLNYGIFPSANARFIIYFGGLPEHFHVGPLTVATFPCVMLIILSLSVWFTWMGGQLTAMITDCVEGLVSNVLFLLVAITLLYLFGWHRISEAMMKTTPGNSLLDPFDSWKIEDFNIWFQLIAIFFNVYGYMAWQGNQGFNASAASPHEAKMGRILGSWRSGARGTMIILVALCGYTLMHHADFAPEAAVAEARLAPIANPQIRDQMQVPTAMSVVLPAGVRGAFCLILVFAMLAVDISFLHSWGSIFVQDVLLPFRRRRLEPQQHLRWLRLAIAGVAVFAFFFSLWFRQTDYILMFQSLTGAIFIAGAGSVIIGGLYWARATTAGAWMATIAGCVLALAGIIVRQIDPNFPLNGQVIALVCAVSAITVYVTAALASSRAPFNMECLLHRGIYAVDSEGKRLPSVEKPPRTWRSYLGIDENFTRGDKIIVILLFCWSMLMFVPFLVFTVWNLIQRWPVEWWSTYWYLTTILIPIGLGVITTVWFSWGGLRDLRRLIVTLRKVRHDVRDDGTVTQPQQPHQNSAPAPQVPEIVVATGIVKGSPKPEA